MNEHQIIDEIIKSEGVRFTDHPQDRGGPTKFGITIETLSVWRGRSCTRDDVRTLTMPEARQVYSRRYIQKPNFDKIRDPLLRYSVIDAGVHHGTGWAARRLQEVAEVLVDGVVGPKTLRAVNSGHSAYLGLMFNARRTRKFAQIVDRDARRGGYLNKGQVKFILGWVRRSTSLIMKRAQELRDRDVR